MLKRPAMALYTWKRDYETMEQGSSINRPAIESPNGFPATTSGEKRLYFWRMISGLVSVSPDDAMQRSDDASPCAQMAHYRSAGHRYCRGHRAVFLWTSLCSQHATRPDN